LQNQQLSYNIVPILTQSEDWALYQAKEKAKEKEKEFQSSPSPKTGRYFKVPFNQHPIEVPILTQSEDWALFINQISQFA
jgi:hypothetical protein